MRIDAHSSVVSGDSAFVHIRKRAIQLTEDMVFGASVKPHPFQGDKKDNGDGIGRCKECGKPWKYKAHWRLAADGVNAYEMRDNNGVFLDEDDIDDVDAGGPGSGWTAENGHVSHLTPQAKGQKLQKMGYSLDTHNPIGTASKEVWSHPSAGLSVTVSKYNTTHPGNDNLRKYEVTNYNNKAAGEKVFAGHQFSKVEEAHAKLTGQQPATPKVAAAPIVPVAPNVDLKQIGKDAGPNAKPDQDGAKYSTTGMSKALVGAGYMLKMNNNEYQTTVWVNQAAEHVVTKSDGSAQMINQPTQPTYNSVDDLKSALGAGTSKVAETPSSKDGPSFTSGARLTSLTQAGYQYSTTGESGQTGKPVDVFQHHDTGDYVHVSEDGTWKAFPKGGAFTPTAQGSTASSLADHLAMSAPKEPSIPAVGKNQVLQDAGYKVGSSSTQNGQAVDIWNHPDGSAVKVTATDPTHSSWEHVDKNGQTTNGKMADDLKTAIQNQGGVAKPTSSAPTPAPAPKTPTSEFGVNTDKAWQAKAVATISDLWSKASASQKDYSSTDNVWKQAAKSLGVPMSSFKELADKVHSWQGGTTANDGNTVGKWAQQIVNEGNQVHPGLYIEHLISGHLIDDNYGGKTPSLMRGYSAKTGPEGAASNATSANVAVVKSFMKMAGDEGYQFKFPVYGAEGYTSDTHTAENFGSGGFVFNKPAGRIPKEWVMSSRDLNPGLWTGYGSEHEWCIAAPGSKMSIDSDKGDKVIIASVKTGTAPSHAMKVLMRVMEADGWKFEVEGKTITVTMPPTWSAAAWWKSIHQPGVTSVSSSEDEEVAATFSPGVALRSSIREKALGVESKAYKLAGLTSFQGLPISIETKKGQVRKGTNHDGTPWSVVMPADYGYIKGTKGADGQHVDCFIGPLKDAKFAYIFHINNDATGDYDEDKALLGFKSADVCVAMLKQAYDNWDEISHSMTMLPMHEFIRKVLHTAGLKRPGKLNAAEVL